MDGRGGIVASAFKQVSSVFSNREHGNFSPKCSCVIERGFREPACFDEGWYCTVRDGAACTGATQPRESKIPVQPTDLTQTDHVCLLTRFLPYGGVV